MKWIIMTVVWISLIFSAFAYAASEDGCRVVIINGDWVTICCFGDVCSVRS